MKKLKNIKRTKRWLKLLKPLNIKGVSPLRYLTPFRNKKINLEYLYNLIYLINKLLTTNFKPIPYSAKLSTIEKEKNKGMVESIIYELRLLFGISFLIMISHITYIVITESEFGYFNTIFLISFIFIIILMLNITIKLTQGKKIMKTSSCNLNEPLEVISITKKMIEKDK